MSEKRKDNKGRLLRTGESQRKDLTYMYRYKDNDGTRRSVYAPSLAELREKEEEIGKILTRGFAVGSKTTGKQLLSRFMKSKLSIRRGTYLSYVAAVKKFEAHSISDMPVSDVTRSVMKDFFVEQYKNGAAYGTLKFLKAILKQVYEQAVEDDLILKNPCGFTLSSIIPAEKKERHPLTENQMIELLEFAKNSEHKDYYSQLVVLAYTGMRVSESCALTVQDIDFSNNLISITKQVTYHSPEGKKEHVRSIEEPKTKASVRMIPMNAEVREVLRDAVIEARARRVQPVVNGCSGFLFLRNAEMVRVAKDVDGELNKIVRDYNRTYKRKLPHITPHMLRHTFCTESIAKGIDPKSVQYMMGHKTSQITMDVYAHVNKKRAIEAYARAFGE